MTRSEEIKGESVIVSGESGSFINIRTSETVVPVEKLSRSGFNSGAELANNSSELGNLWLV